MRIISFSLLCLFLMRLEASSCNQTPDTVGMHHFLTDLLQRMTLEEKIGQLHLIAGTDAVSGESKGAEQSRLEQEISKGNVGALINARGLEKIRFLQQTAVERSRLGIPLLFGMDFLHGYETIFPIPLGMAASWNMAAIEQACRIAAIEGSADGLNWIYSPMVDITRDPRWGRISEGAGESAFLGAAIAQAQVYGYQGKTAYADSTYILACLKHFALYGASEAGRDYSVVDMSHARMFNDYLPPYKAAIDAGIGSVMSSFNEVDGIPATANHWLLTDLLRNKWGFKGFVVTDYASINDITRFGMGDAYKAAILSLRAGTDMDMEGYAYHNHLKKALEEQDIALAEIDRSCLRILEIKYKMGLFSNPYKYCSAANPADIIYSAEHRNTARTIAGETFVLLKNENNILPMKKRGTIALIGTHAHNRPNMLGSWGWPANINKAATLLEGLKEATGDSAQIVYARGCQPYEDMGMETWLSLTKDFETDPRSNQELIDEALQVASKADVIVAALGESSEMSGESSSRTRLNIPAPQQQLLRALVGTGKPVVLLLFTGRPLAITWENEHIPAILNVWFPGTEAAYAIPDVLFGHVNPSGKLTSTWPQNEGQIPVYHNIHHVSKPMDKWFQKFRSGYLDSTNEPLFPFGYGLSYTQYKYGAIRLNDTVLQKDGQITASIDISNIGKFDGSETVQLYIRDVEASFVRPVKELKGFKKVFIPAATTQTVEFTVSPDMLMFYDNAGNEIIEQGRFELMLGGDSKNFQSTYFIYTEKQNK